MVNRPYDLMSAMASFPAIVKISMHVTSVRYLALRADSRKTTQQETPAKRQFLGRRNNTP